jgi:hypothetical protein
MASLRKVIQMDLNDLADRYVAVWNERDPEKRRRQIADLWIPQEHYVESQKAIGYEELGRRVRESHNEFVREAGDRFRDERDVVTFYWEMLPADGNSVLGKGLEFVGVSDAGKLISDYQFYPA